MGEIISYIEDGITITDILIVISFVAVLVKCIERFIKWSANYLKAYYNQKRGIEEKEDTLELHTKEIKMLTEQINKMVTVINSQYEILNKKIDEQNNKLEQFDLEGKKRDCAILRDRIMGGMRYFSQNKDEYGVVRISVSDHENMSNLFTEYFECGGNGTVEVMHKNEFKTWVVDR